MKRDFLTNLGLEGEQVDKIMAEHGKTVNALKDDADKAKDLEAQIEDYKGQLKDRDKQLDDLKKQSEGNEDLQQKIKDLQKANDDTKKDYQEKLDQQRKESKLELALKDAKAKNPKAVKALLDAESIKLDGDKLLGLEEQLKVLQESDGYLFDDGKPSGRQPHPPNPEGGGNAVTKEKFNKMGYKERADLFRTNPDLYNQLSKGDE